MQLTQKETGLIKDLKDQEKLCVEKYTKHADAAHDPQLKQLFSQLAEVERSHLKAITTLEGGTVPATVCDAPAPNDSFTAIYGVGETNEKAADAYLCTDLLATEKHASHLYDTCIFEFCSEPARAALNTIQKQEQVHGKLLYDYMSKNSMYC